MPEFFAEHVPNDVDDFTAGYLGAAEWLIDETVNRNRIRGWTNAAVAKAKEECARFQRNNESDLTAFCEATGRDRDLAGFCFFVNRNGHGTGFWDREAGECGDKLSDASEKYGGRDVDVYRNRLCWG